MRRADPFATLFQDVLKKHRQSKHQQKGVTQVRQRVILGQAWVFDWRTISRGLEKRGSPITWAIAQTRYKQSPNCETRVKPRCTDRKQETMQNEKTRLGVSNPAPGELPSYRFKLQPQSSTPKPANQGLKGYLLISERCVGAGLELKSAGR